MTQHNLPYSPTLSSARQFAEEEQLDVWIHRYLNEEGNNAPFSIGLKLTERYYIAPALFPLELFPRCTGPETGMRYPVDSDGWSRKTQALKQSIQSGTDMPPLIVHYANNGFELNDGNHRHKAYEDLGVPQVWAIVWITEEAELQEFLDRYGDLVKGRTIIRK